MADQSLTLQDNKPAPGVWLRWLALVLVSLPMMGNYYIYDSINPLADIFTKQLGFTDENIGWLNSSYSLAAVLTLFFGGVIIDRIGTRKSIIIFSALCLAGAGLTAVGGNLAIILSGRAVLGLGAESLIVAITTAIAKWFRGKELGFALGINLTIARLASVGADNSPSWASWAFYPHGTQQPASAHGPLLIAVGAGVLCVLGAIFYFWIEKSASGKYRLGKGGEIDKLNVKQGLKFSRSYWYIVGLCITFYSAIFPFRTFAVKFLMHTHFNGLSPDVARESAGFFNSILPLSAMIATPLFGLLVDKVGRRSLFMMVGSVLLMPVYLIMAYTQISLWIPIIMMGISFSMIPAVMWPSVAYIVDEKRLGTGYALMSLIQQIGFFAFNWAIGFANDLTGAGESNPGGYAMGMWIFSILGFLGLFFSIMLRRSEMGPHGHGLETIKV